MSENESGNVLGDCLGELDEMGLEDALGAIIEECQGEISASDGLPNEVDPDLDALHSDAEVLRFLKRKHKLLPWRHWDHFPRSPCQGAHCERVEGTHAGPQPQVRFIPSHW